MTDENTNDKQSTVEAAYTDNTLLLRIIGLGDMHTALIMRDFISSSMEETKYGKVILDLQFCQGLDSTFMGTMVCICGMLQEHKSYFLLCNVSEHNKSLLEMLGVDKLLTICGDLGIPDLEFTRIDPLPGDPKERIELIRHAHNCLITADEKNQERFGNFLAVLEAELDAESE